METILCGVDLGGTKLSAGLFDLQGRLIDKNIVFDQNNTGFFCPFRRLLPLII